MGISRVIIGQSNVVLGSPALAAETAICTAGTVPSPVDSDTFLVIAYLALTIGTSGVSLRLRLRRGAGVGGTTVGDTGLLTVVAANLEARSIMAIDTPGIVDGQQYTLTAIIGSGAAASAVSAAVIAVFAL